MPKKTGTPATRYKEDCLKLDMVQASRPDFREAMEGFFEDSAIHDSRKKMLGTALKSFADTKLSPTLQDLKNEHIAPWLNTLSSTSTQRAYLSALRALYERFVQTGLLPGNPVLKRVASSTQMDLSVPALIANAEGAKEAVDRFIRETYPQLFGGEAGRRPEGVDTPLYHLTALRHFCKFMEDGSINALADIGQQEMDGYLASSPGDSTLSNLRQLFNYLRQAGVKDIPAVPYHAETQASWVLQAPSLVSLMLGSDITDPLSVLDNFAALQGVAQYRKLHINALENFAAYLLNIAGINSLGEVSVETLVSYRDGVLRERFKGGTTADTYFGYIRRFLNFLEDREFLPGGNPASAYMKRDTPEDPANARILLKGFRQARRRVTARSKFEKAVPRKKKAPKTEPVETPQQETEVTPPPEQKPEAKPPAEAPAESKPVSEPVSKPAGSAPKPKPKLPPAPKPASKPTPVPHRPLTQGETVPDIDAVKNLDYGQRYLLAGLVDFLARNKITPSAANNSVRHKGIAGRFIGETYITAATEMEFIAWIGGKECYTPAFIQNFKELKEWSKLFLEAHQKATRALYADYNPKP